MAETLKKQLNVEPKLIQGSGGVFEVRLNGTLIWSKHDMGRFPEHPEVVEKIKAVTAK